MQHLNAELIRDFLQGRLSPAVNTFWQRHVGTCGECQSLVARERTLLKLLALHEPAVCAPGAMDRLLARAQTLQPPPRPRFLPRAKALTAVTALAGLLVTAQILFVSFQTSAEEARRVRQQWDISPQTQKEIVKNLAALKVLQEKPWVADEYEALRGVAGGLPAAGGGRAAQSESEAWERWQALSTAEQGRCVQAFQEIERREDAKQAFANAQAFALLASPAQEQLCQLRNALYELEKKQLPEQRRLLMGLPPGARILRLHRLLEAQDASAAQTRGTEGF